MASVESILLYGSEAWTLPAVQEARLDGCYTSMLRMVFNVTRRERIRNNIIIIIINTVFVYAIYLAIKTFRGALHFT